MSFYSSLAATAKSLLTEFGQTIAFTRIIEGGFDPELGEDLTATELTFSSVGAISNYKTNEVNGTSILASDKKLLLESTNEPLVNDVAKDTNGLASTVLAVKALAPSGQAVIYELQLRH